uniref:exodeoxyribonuclease V subunit alpha n=1 Tax=Ningiella ruwaisensis TaxID=2364274 RepID=UPI0010A0A104|nr:exodeoxyribonuclease V subunit alpha [Ningiella ruwaisensis]
MGILHTEFGSKNRLIKLPFESVDEMMLVLQESIEDIEAIDFYMASYLTGLCLQHIETLPSISLANERPAADNLQQDAHFLFYLFIALNIAQRRGNTCLAFSDLTSPDFWSRGESQSVFPQDFSDIKALEQRLSGLKNVLSEVDGITLSEKALYTRRFWVFEQSFCAQVRRRLNINCFESAFSEKHFKDLWPRLFKRSSDELETDWQQVAVMHALYNQFSIITGGAGTGKTYTLSRLVAFLLCASESKIHASKIALLAPTGKAVNRLFNSMQHEFTALEKTLQTPLLQQLAQMQIQTIHRLLGINPSHGGSKYDEFRKLNLDCVIVDEASMVDLALMHRLFSALPEDCKIVLVGDPNQLPSVETGSLLADLVAIAPKTISTSRLAKYSSQNPFLIARCDDGQPKASLDYVVRLQAVRRSNGEIVRLAEAVLEGNVADTMSCLKLTSQAAASEPNALYAQWVQQHISQVNSSALSKLITDELLHNYHALFTATSLEQAWQAISSYACLLPNRRGFAGTEHVNQLIEQGLATRYAQVQVGQAYLGKPILVTQNDYNLGLFNGDVGFLWHDEAYNSLEQKEGMSKAADLWAFFPSKSGDGFDKLSIYTLPAYELTYAMTIHKTQGSEFKHVDIILPESSQRYATRALLYTGVTRAKDSVRIIADEQTLKSAIKKQVHRVSGIKEYLT